jgi:DNA repair exonuclease SbcCD nuclease subunit
MPLNAVFTSDWHIGGLQKVLKNPLPYQIKEIEKAYIYAQKHSIDQVIVPGDLCHTPNMKEDELLALLTLLLKYDGYITTHYILGNHDVESVKKTSLDLLSSLVDAGLFKTFHIYKKPTVKIIKGVTVAFMPFPHLEVPKTDKPPLVVAHIEIVGALGDNGRKMKGGHEMIRQTGDFIVSGHLHLHQYIKSKRALFIGTPYQTNFGESLPKGFVNLTAKYVKGQLKVAYEFVKTKPNFTLETKVIGSNEEWSDLSEHVRYKLLLTEGITIPKDIMVKLQNIVSITGINKNVFNKEEYSATEIATDLPTFSITTGLKAYLKASGCDTNHIKKAQRIAKEAASTLGLSKI